jgi:hypothetical protein
VADWSKGYESDLPRKMPKVIKVELFVSDLNYQKMPKLHDGKKITTLPKASES